MRILTQLCLTHMLVSPERGKITLNKQVAGGLVQRKKINNTELSIKCDKLFSVVL